MGKWFTYHLVLFSVGSPSGLAVYHYFIRSDGQTQQTQDCCCKEQNGCSTTCPSPCKAK